MWSRPDTTVWRLERARRAAVLVDMQAYFKAARAAMANARHSIHILGWAFDPDARFAPGEDGGGPSRDRVGAFLKHLACNRPEVDVRLLVWNAVLPIAASQNYWTQRAKLAFRNTPVNLKLDGALPLGACHHQKAIIVDDRVAFCGGGDIAPDRWDTAEHLDRDGRRTSHLGVPFAPRHEVMALVDGPAACSLGELFRDRWKRASGQDLAPPNPDEDHDPWPEDIPHQFEDVQVGLARTVPAFRGWPEVREAEGLHLASIAGARRTIYMENQYFASPIIAEALAARLAQPGGPEVVLITTLHSPSWFDQITMDRTRLAFLQRLKTADEEGRRGEGPDAKPKLHAYCPVTRRGKPIIVHAKVAVIDDQLLRVGSANINNRSTGFDTECDLVLEAEDGAAGAVTRERIRRTRDHFLAHWLARPLVETQAAIREHRSLAGAIQALEAAGRPRLRPLLPRALGPVATVIAKYHLGDPAGPQDSLRPWARRRVLERHVAAMAQRLEAEGLPDTPDELSPETV